jgi:hypothetical protein
MRMTILPLACLAACALAAPAAAQVTTQRSYDMIGAGMTNVPYLPPRGLDFAALEAAAAPHAPDNAPEPAQKNHPALARQQASAVRILRAAVPVGMPAELAAETLRKAGADCGKATAVQIVCHYSLPEPRDEGPFWKDVLWRIWLGVAEGRVTALDLSWRLP